MLLQVGFKFRQVASMLLQIDLKAVSGSILEASWSCQNVNFCLKTKGFLTFFKLLVLCFKLPRVGSNWPQVASSWPQVDLKLSQVDLKMPQSGLSALGKHPLVGCVNVHQYIILSFNESTRS